MAMQSLYQEGFGGIPRFFCPYEEKKSFYEVFGCLAIFWYLLVTMVFFYPRKYQKYPKIQNNDSGRQRRGQTNDTQMDGQTKYNLVSNIA